MRMQSSDVIYGNYQVLSPDNILMFRCGEKRAKWYLNRNLAEIIDTHIIRLNFEPNGLGNHNKGYGLEEMKNMCVNCGSKLNLTRHHIVPYCYRRYLPENIKSHNFHDVLPMCIECHNKYERKADQLKSDLSMSYNAPIHGFVEKNHEMIRYIKLAKTILNKNLPIKKKKELSQIIKSELDIKRLTKKKLLKISLINFISVRKTHGEIVMSQIQDTQGFIEMWRSHFIENNDCKFLPENWDIKTKSNEQ